AGKPHVEAASPGIGSGVAGVVERKRTKDPAASGASETDASERSQSPRGLAVVPPSPTAARAATIVAGPSTRRPTTATAACLGSRLVDDEVPVAEHTTVQLLHGPGRLLRRRHLHEAEAPWPARELVGHDADRLDGSGLLEELPKVLLRGLVGQVAYEELGGHRSPPASGRDKKAPEEARLSEGRHRTHDASIQEEPRARRQ